MKKKMKEAVSFLLRFGLSAALLVYLFYKADISKTWEIVKSANIAYLLLGLLFTFLIFGIILLRWLVIIWHMRITMPIGNVIRWFFIGNFFNLFLPTSSGGDVIKTIGLCKDTPDRAKVVASVLLDRVFGFIGIILVAFVSYFVARKIAQDRLLLFVIVGLLFISWSGLLFLLNEKLYTWACGIFNRFPRAKEKLLKLHHAIALVRGKLFFMMLVISMSCLAQIILGVTFFFTAKALHQDVELIYCIAFAPLTCVAAAMPSIGGLGFRDFGSVFLFTKVGMSTAAAMSLSLINFSYVVAVGLVGAIVYVCSIFSGRVQRDPSDPGSSL
ncbi:MAG TPA: lysylphosphatidylglycerol synthase transmembrane domain-containing protein [Candidatus Omnitrophota bacterium]|nr:lysylphosphatidylglycerol synthase transmembrane domain-containing protein [Candidatus Omnitrophota bacterium]